MSRTQSNVTGSATKQYELRGVRWTRRREVVPGIVEAVAAAQGEVGNSHLAGVHDTNRGGLLPPIKGSLSENAGPSAEGRIVELVVIVVARRPGGSEVDPDEGVSREVGSAPRSLEPDPVPRLSDCWVRHTRHVGHDSVHLEVLGDGQSGGLRREIALSEGLAEVAGVGNVDGLPVVVHNGQEGPIGREAELVGATSQSSPGASRVVRNDEGAGLILG